MIDYSLQPILGWAGGKVSEQGHPCAAARLRSASPMQEPSPWLWAKQHWQIYTQLKALWKGNICDFIYRGML